jgi:hypothetical protein
MNKKALNVISTCTMVALCSILIFSSNLYVSANDEQRENEFTTGYVTIPLSELEYEIIEVYLDEFNTGSVRRQSSPISIGGFFAPGASTITTNAASVDLRNVAGVPSNATVTNVTVTGNSVTTVGAFINQVDVTNGQRGGLAGNRWQSMPFSPSMRFSGFTGDSVNDQWLIRAHGTTVVPQHALNSAGMNNIFLTVEFRH